MQAAIVPPSSMALQIRMQWWRDALDEIYDSKKDDENVSAFAKGLSISCWNSPVVRALSVAHAQSNFTRRFLERLIDAREADLELNQYKRMEDTLIYAEETVSSILYLNLESLGVREEAADQVAWYAGIGIGLATALRATPFRLQYGEIPLPASIIAPNFSYDALVLASLEQQKSGGGSIALSEANAQVWDEAVRHMAHVASNHLIQAQDLQSQVPRAARGALLPVVPALYYLSQLKEAKFNLFDPGLNDPTKRLNLLLMLGRTWLTGVF
jgi:NADH dehydrogenase [ubiquinone] 1 alpha subcomplex assembly factor 6